MNEPNDGVATPAPTTLTIELLPGGVCRVVARWQGGPDAVYPSMPDTQALALAVPMSMAELRLQVETGQRCTLEQSNRIKAALMAGNRVACQPSPGSALTV